MNKHQTQTPKRLQPMWSLLHPVWWVALGLLALNDHFLKGAGVLPGWFTGKLSDFAGLFLAPPLLAALLKVRTRQGLLACYGATGGVFAAIQLSEGLAGHWVDLLASAGVHWRVWSDPTDLLALPMLWASWRVLEPQMQALPQNLRTAWRRAVQATGATAGALLCMATSPPDEPLPPGPTNETVVWDTIQGSAFIRNATDSDIAVRVRILKSDVATLDCELLEKDPGGLIQAEALDPATTWEMPADSNMAIDFEGTNSNTSRGCWAALIEGEGLGSRLVFVRSLTTFSAPGGGAPPSGPTVTISLDSSGRLAMQGDNGLDLHFPHRTDPSEVAAECQPQSDANRLAWSDPPWSSNPFVIESQEIGPDGCWGVTLRDTKATTPIAQPWYVCVSAQDWPFVVGDHITPNRWVANDAQTQALVVERVGLESGDPLTENLILTLNAGRSQDLLIGDGVTLESAEITTCDQLVDDCGTVQQAAQVQISRSTERLTLRAGEQGVLSLSGDATLSVTVVHSQHRALVRTSCSIGPSQSTEDTELVLIQRTPITAPPSP